MECSEYVTKNNKCCATFQKTKNVGLSAIKWKFALDCASDIVVLSRFAAPHRNHVKHVLMPIEGSGVILKLENCTTIAKTNDYLCQVIRQRRLETALHTRNGIKGLKAPRAVTNLKIFFGQCNVCIRLVPRLARPSSPLNDKLREEDPFIFKLKKDDLEAETSQ